MKQNGAFEILYYYTSLEVVQCMQKRYFPDMGVNFTKNLLLKRKIYETTEMNGADKAKTGQIGNRPYWVFSLSIIIRAGHQVGAAVFLTAYLLSGSDPPSRFFLFLVFGSGCALILTEWMRHRELYREFAGLAIILKILLIGAAYHQMVPAREAVLAGFVIASIGSHAPKMLRHRLLF